MTSATKDWLRKLKGFFQRHGGKVGLVLIGVLLGNSVFALRACSPEPHEHAESKTTEAPEDSDTTIWTCAMHPQVRQPEPGQCPICGMDLIPVTSDQTKGPSDPNRIVLSDRARKLAELRTTTVRRRAEASADLRLLGRIEPDETTLKTVTAWTGGRIDRLYVNVTGERVHAGQVIATLYSPEVFAAHQDLLVAKRQVGRMAQSPESSRNAAEAALNAARERLRLLGVPDNELARMETEERPTRSVSIRTPFGGTVIERLATEGAYVSTGTPLYRVANLKTLWVQLDAYESDLPKLSVGQQVRIEVQAMPGEVFEGKVTFIDPTLEPQRRTAQVRVEVENQDGRLRPGMFAEATVAAEPRTGGSPLVVPASAPLFTGRRAIVYVEIKSGDRVAYEPRTVRLGPRLGKFYPVVAGLAEGEQVVTRGAFALDADLQIRGGSSMMSAPDDEDAGTWDAAIELPAAERKKLALVVDAYLAVQEALAADDLEAAKKAAETLSEAAATVKLERPSEAKAAWAEVETTLRKHAAHVAMAGALEGARTGFEALSDEIQVLLGRFGNPTDKALSLAFCPMAAGSEGASWIQKGREIENSYFGESMRTCGEIRQELDPGSYLMQPKTTQRPESAPAPAPAGGHQH